MKKKSYRCSNCGKGTKNCKDMHATSVAFACTPKKSRRTNQK